LNRTGGQVFDYYDIRLQYDSMSAILKCSYLVKEEGPRYILHGEDGSFLKWGIDPQEEQLKKGLLPLGDHWGCEEEAYWGVLNARRGTADYRVKKPTVPGNYRAFYENLYQAVRNAQPLAVSPDEARNVIHILEMCLESHLHKKTVFCQ